MKILSNWRSVKLWESEFERDLRRRHSLRTHGMVIGSATLLAMWGVSWLLMAGGVERMALRYAITLGAGYLVYLGVLRWWARRLVDDRAELNPDGGDMADLVDVGVDGLSQASGGGEGSALSDVASGALDVAGGADEGALIVVPVLAIFLIGAALLFGAGALVLLYFGSDVLLAVALELAFTYVSARAAVRMAREGWLSAAVRLTWKPLLGALLCAVALGAAIDHFLPEAGTLPQAVRMLRGR